MVISQPKWQINIRQQCAGVQVQYSNVQVWDAAVLALDPLSLPSPLLQLGINFLCFCICISVFVFLHLHVCICVSVIIFVFFIGEQKKLNWSVSSGLNIILNILDQIITHKSSCPVNLYFRFYLIVALYFWYKLFCISNKGVAIAGASVEIVFFVGDASLQEHSTV